jgi:Flp pilus assembly protein TadD
MSKKTLSIALIALVGVAALAYFLPERERTHTASSDKLQLVRPGSPSKENVSQTVKEKLDHLRSIVEKDPKNATARIELARLLQDSHNNQEAAKYFAEVLALEPRNVDARIDYSLCLFQLGKQQDAMEQCQQVLKVNASEPRALFNLGAIHANSGRPDSARSYWSKLISRHPGHELSVQAKENLKKLPAPSSTM